MLEGSVVVVTGGSAGVGRAAAVTFARKGADVALLARGAERLDAARREIEGLGVRVPHRAGRSLGRSLPEAAIVAALVKVAPPMQTSVNPALRRPCHETEEY